MVDEKHRLEFYPEVIFVISESALGGYSVRPIPKQSKNSKEMYRFAQRLSWQNRDKIELVTPSRCESKVLAQVKWKKFKIKIRLWRLGILKLPALVFHDKVLCQGKLDLDDNFELAI